METKITVPEDVTVSTDGFDVRVEGPGGTVERRLWYPDVTVRVDDDTIAVESDRTDRKVRATVGTFESHINNAIHGVLEGWEYGMEIEYAHFPMQVRVEDDEVVIENFLGEKAPRRCAIVGDTEVSVDGEELTIAGPNKEDVGQTAGNIEQLTRITDKDPRKFEDGVYITKKPEATPNYG